MTKNAVTQKMFDKRVVSRNLEKDLVSHKDYNNFLSSLPDDAEEGEAIKIEEEKKETTEKEII